MRSTRPYAVSIVSASMSPDSRAATTPAAWAGLAGISRSSPAFSARTRSWTAPQSDTTNPSKPHSPRSTSVSRKWFSLAKTPFTRLYEHITVHGFAVVTTFWKPRR